MSENTSYSEAGLNGTLYSQIKDSCPFPLKSVTYPNVDEALDSLINCRRASEILTSLKERESNFQRLPQQLDQVVEPVELEIEKGLRSFILIELLRIVSNPKIHL